MKSYTPQTEKSPFKPAAASHTAKHSPVESAAPPHDRAIAQLEQIIEQSPRMQAERHLAAAIHNSPRMVAQRRQLEGMFGRPMQRKGIDEEEPLQAVADRELDSRERQAAKEEDLLQRKSESDAAPLQLAEETAPRANNTGLPDHLKSDIEHLSGIAMDDVKVHYNSSKPAQLQALAYAQGTDIHVAPGQAQHVPHEAWHVVQQKQGRVKPTLQAKGVAINDDRGLEREADLMGARASQTGKSIVQVRASDVDGGEVGGLTSIATQKKARIDGGSNLNVIQRNVTVNGEQRYLTRTTWPQVSGLAPITALTAAEQLAAEQVLDRWIHASASSFITSVVSEDRDYANWNDLALALAGEVRSAANLIQENTLAANTYTSANIGPRVLAFITRLQVWHAAQAPAMQQAAQQARGRYRIYYGSSLLAFAFGYGATLDDALIHNVPANIDGRVTLAADYALFARRYVPTWNMRMTVQQNTARRNHWNTEEGALWTQDARINNAPLSAGPSATTGQLMELGETIGATPGEMEAIAWAIFAFFNSGLDVNQSGTHRFHEVMAVAANYGVPYNPWAYGAVP